MMTTHDQPLLLLPGDSSPSAPPRTRLFHYDHQLFDDPGPEYTTQAVLDFLAATYPELRHGAWTSRINAAGIEEITFHKVTGEKGAGLSPRQIIEALDTITARPLTAVSLTRQIMDLEAAGSLTAEAVLALGPAVELALHEADQMRLTGQRITSQLLALPALPGHRVPLGF